MPGRGQVHGAGRPDSSRTDHWKHTRHHGDHAPQRGGWNPEDPEDPAAERTLDDRDDDDAIHAAVDDVAYPSEQRFASCPFEGKQIGNPRDDPVSVAEQQKHREDDEDERHDGAGHVLRGRQCVSSNHARQLARVLSDPRHDCGAIESQTVTQPLVGLPQRRPGLEAGLVREHLLQAGAQRHELIDRHSREEQEGNDEGHHHHHAADERAQRHASGLPHEPLMHGIERDHQNRGPGNHVQKRSHDQQTEVDDSARSRRGRLST